MKKKTGIVVGSIAAILMLAIVVWQFVKKDVVKNAIENAVAKESGNDYYIKYDSSYIDEVGGNAAFFNIVLQSDSAQKKLLENDTSLAPAIYNVQVKALTITGANIPSFLQKNAIEATKIKIVRPVITIISTRKKEHKMNHDDTLALYKKLTGKFEKIHAGEIEIVDAVIAFANGNNSPHTTIQDANLVLKDFKVDKDHNYNDIISYFIKDLVVTAKSVTNVNESKQETFVAEGIKYSAPGRNISINKILQKNTLTNTPIIDIKEVNIAGINTRQFVYANKIEADSLTVKSGRVTIYQKQNSGSAKTSLEMDNDYFNKAQVKNIVLGPTDIKIIKAKRGQAPILLQKVEFSASGLPTVKDGSSLQNILAGSNWKLLTQGLNLQSSDGMYNFVFGPVQANSGDKTMLIKTFNLKPTITWAQYVKRIKVQHDYYEFNAKDIKLTQLNLAKLVNDQEVDAVEMSIVLNLKSFNDRLVDYDKSSKVGKYPQQQLIDLDIPVNIRKVVVNNSSVLYRERGRISAKTGDVSFSGINAIITNVTNIPALIKQDNKMIWNASAKFMGASNLKTIWELPLSKANATFKVSGSLTGFNASVLNKISEPLGMASFSRGQINGLTFSLTGDDYHSDGEATLKYDDLKIKLLKGNGDSTNALKDKDLVSFAANILVKNSNPKHGNLRTGKINFDRDITKSFFNLLWKSIFQASKKITMGKDDG